MNVMFGERNKDMIYKMKKPPNGGTMKLLENISHN